MAVLTQMKRIGLILMGVTLTVNTTSAQNHFALDSGIPRMMVYNAVRSRVTIGEIVYVGKAQLTGTALDTVTVSIASDMTVTIPFETINTWEISASGKPESYFREGLTVGLVGALMGGFVGLVKCDSEPSYACFLMGAIYFGAPVYILAPVIGSSMEKPDEWTMIYKFP